jgi:hypothetical protein
MICKKLSLVALSGLTAALSLSAMAQDTTTTTTMDSTTSATTTAPMSMEPMMATGTVLRYYTDRTGYVTAADVQTADGVRMVRFSPGMAQRIYSTYPVGGQFAGTLQPSMSMGMSRYDVVSLGDTMPAAGMMKPDMTSDLESLRAVPYIVAGSKQVQLSGKLNSLVTDDDGNIIGLVLSNVKMPGATAEVMTASAPMDGTTGLNAAPMNGMGESLTFVRVPLELSHRSGAQFAGSPRVAPLFRGASVEVVGYQEAPRYGVVSAYENRVFASALVVNGQSVGALGLPMVQKGKKGTILGLLTKDGRTRTAEENMAMGQGYMTYGSSSDMGAGGMTTDTSMTTTTGS